MSLDKVTPGKDVPNAFNVIIEIPMNADPVKYEVDKAIWRDFCGSLHEHRDALSHQLWLRTQNHFR